MRCFTDVSRFGEEGQATVEAAFALPVLLTLVALLLQPAVLLYDRCVMGAAAAETCRVAATGGCSGDSVRAFASRRLAALPDLDLFHKDACPWEIEVSGGASGEPVSVRIEGHLQTLPLPGVAAAFSAASAADGCSVLSCEVESSLRPAWLDGVEGGPGEWIGQWR